MTTTIQHSYKTRIPAHKRMFSFQKKQKNYEKRKEQKILGSKKKRNEWLKRNNKELYLENEKCLNAIRKEGPNSVATWSNEARKTDKKNIQLCS